MRRFIRYTDDCERAALGDPKTERHRLGIRVFASGVLESISKAPYWAPVALFGPVVGLCLWSGHRTLGAASTGIIFLGGWLVWTLLEYVLHRFLFHWEGDGDEARFRHFLIHGYHHVFPSDPLRLVAPPMLSVPVALVLAPLYRLFAGAGTCWPLFAGTVAGYVGYDLVHYYVHHARPTTRLGKWLRRHHMLHHFGGEDARYGVSSPLWDAVFGTLGGDRAAKPREATTT